MPRAQVPSSRGVKGSVGAQAAAERARALIDTASEPGPLTRALRLCQRALGTSLPGPLRHDLLLLQGMALNRLARCEDALEPLAMAQALFPDSLEVALEQALALFELCRFDEAERLFAQVVRSDPDEAWAHHHLGLIFERRGEAAQARRCFARALRAEPEALPRRLRLTEAGFDAALARALHQLPMRLEPFLRGVPLTVEPWPPLEDLLTTRPPLSPSILGVFRGRPVGERGERSIALFRHNLERSARDVEELVEQIAVTLLHEVGHLMGLDEAALRRRGLE